MPSHITPAHIQVVDCAAEIELDFRDDEGEGVVARQCPEALGDEQAVPETMEI